MDLQSVARQNARISTPLEYVISSRAYINAAALVLLDALIDERTTDGEIRAAAAGLEASVRTLAHSTRNDEADLWAVAIEALRG